MPVTDAERQQVEHEIREHSKWCGPDCQTFLPQVYRDKRYRGRKAEQLQNDYDSCHIFR